MEYIGIDMGGSFIKAALLDVGNFEIREIKKEVSPDFVPDVDCDIKEVDADGIVAITRK